MSEVVETLGGTVQDHDCDPEELAQLRGEWTYRFEELPEVFNNPNEEQNEWFDKIELQADDLKILFNKMGDFNISTTVMPKKIDFTEFEAYFDDEKDIVWAAEDFVDKEEK